MGTTLTGTTPQDTYDSLIKVTDNGPLSGTAKYLSDGLGNDSALALSTSRIGVGTSSPATQLEVSSSDLNNIFVTNPTTSGATTGSGIGFKAYNGTSVAQYAGIILTSNTWSFGTYSPQQLSLGSDGTGGLALRTAVSAPILFHTGGTTAGLSSERMRITSAGVVDLAQGQIKFPVTQVASADPNTLDDYEEGTWTPTINFSGASVGVTYNFNAGRYTKIGNKVTANCFFSVSDKGTSTGSLAVAGLPFALESGTANYVPISIRPSGISFADQLIGYAEEEATQVVLQETTMGGVVTSITEADCATAFSVMFQITYFV